MISRLLITSALVSVLTAVPSLAQTAPESASGQLETADAQADGQTADAGVDGGSILVTGSRIPQPTLESTLPVTVVTGDELFETGQVSLGDILNDLPQLRNTFSQQNSTRFLGTRGLNLLDLRGLGTERTLVLQNGRRHVAGDVLSTGVSVDTNTIPSDLVERVDIVTGGNSSIYGSDAVAGVVNFVLKQDFEGFQIRGQAGLNVDYNDAGNQLISATAGTNFAEGRGNVAVNVEYAHQSRYFASQRGRNLRENNNFLVVDSDAAGTPNGSDGNPDRLFFNDIRSATISLGGQALIYPGAGAPCGRDVLGGAYACSYLFQPGGSLVAQTGTRVGLAPTGNFIGGNGTTSREGELLTLSPDLERISVNLIGHFEVSPAFVPFIEAKYVRSEAFGSQSGPFFSQGTQTGDPGGRERVRLDNPFLGAAERAFLTQQLLASTVNPNTGAAILPTLAEDGTIIRTAAENLAIQRAAIEAGTFRFGVRRNYVDLGIRDERITRETYRVVGGIRGSFNDDWTYEVSANYGEHKENNVILSNINVQRYVLALDSARDPVTGNIVCRSQLNPGGTVPYIDNPAILAQDIAACVPLNPFGEGSVSQAARDYLTVNSSADGKITQFVGSGYVAGDLSQLFELPGGPIGFSVGAEYRRETVAYDLDDLTQQGYAFYNAIPSFEAPAFEVKEAFGELRIPIVKDLPFLQELTVSGSGRVADYNNATGTVVAYGATVDWRPIRDLRFSGSYNRSVRSPNLVELYSAQGQNFAPAPLDPCSARNIGAGSATRAANCAAAGRPANYDYVYTASLETLSGGNPDLREETSDSFTISGIFTPSFIPGFSLRVDYFDITVDDVIASVTAQQILNLCYDSPTLDNQFCSLFERAGAGGGPVGEQPFQVLEGSLLESSLNYAQYKSRGIDTTVGYRRDFSWGTLNLNALWTHTLQRDNFTNPDDPSFANRLLGELADPDDQVNFRGNAKFGPLTLGYQLRWIDKQYLNTYEDFNSINGQPPQNADYADRRFYPDVFYHDVRVDFEVNDDFNLYVGVDNVTDRQPPFGLTGVGAGSGIYDVRGRYGYVGAVANF